MTKTSKATMDRRETERRAGSDRRAQDVTVENERRQTTRRKVQRRRQIDPTTCERDYSEDEIEFMQALDDYKRRSGRMFPTCSEILEVIRDLGYVKSTANLPQESDAVETESTNIESDCADGMEEAETEVIG